MDKEAVVLTLNSPSFDIGKWVREVTDEQQADGSWGRFHSTDSKLKRKWGTTESAMARLKYLGLDRTAISVQKACEYCEILLNNHIALWPEYMEKNELFPKAVPIYIVTALSHFGSDDRLYRQYGDALLSLLHLAFADGEYNREALNQSAKNLLGIEIDNTYMGFGSKYLLIFFQNHVSKIDRDVQRKYLKWLHEQDVIYYSPASLQETITPFTPLRYGLRTIFGRVEILSWLSSFHGFSEEFSEDLAVISPFRQSDGYWDPGNGFQCPRLSADWRSPANRKMDQTYFIQRLFSNIP